VDIRFGPSTVAAGRDSLTPLFHDRQKTYLRGGQNLDQNDMCRDGICICFGRIEFVRNAPGATCFYGWL
jgi:hypothetical protein